MSLKIDRVQLEIVVQQDAARQKMMQLEDEMRKANAELKKVKKQFGENSDEYRRQEAVVKKLKQEYDNLFDEIGVGNLSMKELTNRQQELNNILRQLDPNLPLWKRYNDQLKTVNARIQELKGQARETESAISRLTHGFNKYAAIGTSTIAALTGVTMTARKCVDEFAKIEEAEAGVVKYTGMTKEEVDELNEEFKRIDTRTSREELNRLAGEAGKLGITGKEDVLDFVEAANIINVALGEDLGEDAVKNIGKLATMFGEDKTKGLRGAMLATGSAVNEVAQNSSASEPYLVNFTARVAGAAAQAKMSQADIIGYASVLDQNMQAVEMSGTAFQKVLLKMYQEPTVFAKMAGKDVKEFSELIKTDANEAILQFLETLNRQGGLDKLAPMFKEMGLDGARAAGVLSTMAGKIDDIRAAQALSNQAYNEGVSVVNEFGVQNNTVQAQLDKAKKKFADVRMELGRQLMPVMRNVISLSSLSVRVLGTIVSIFVQYKSTILTAAAGIALYTVAVNASIIADKLKVLWTNKIVAGLKLLYATARAHPWGLLITVLGAFIGLMKDTNKQLTENERLMRMMGDIRKKAAENAAAEKKELNDYLAVARDENRSKKEREAAIKRLNELSPDYLGNLTLEKINTEEATKAVNKYVDSLIILEEIKQAQARIADLNKKRDDVMENGVDNGFWESVQAGFANMVKTGFYDKVNLVPPEWINVPLEAYVNKGVKQLRTIDQEILTLNGHIEENRQKLIALEATKQSGDGGGTPTGDGNDEEDLFKAREEEIRKAMQEEQNLWKEEYYNQQHTQEEYQQALYDSEMTYLLKRKALLEMYGKDSSQIQGQIYDKMIAEANRLANARSAAEKRDKDESYKALDSSYLQDQQDLKRAYLDGDIKTEQEYYAKLKEMERDYLEQRRQMQAGYGDDTSKTDGQLLDNSLKQKKEDKDRDRNEGFKAIDSTSNFEEQLRLLDAMRATDLVSQEEYEKEKTRITAEQSEQRVEKAKAAFDVMGQAASAASQMVNALQDVEASKVTRDYDKKIKAAKKAGKDTSKLEEEKEEAVAAVKKKYADKQFAMAVMEVTVNTAVAAMNAYKAMAGIPIVGPALGAAAAAAAVIAGAAQIAVAKQQRDEAKGLYEGGYSDDYVEGYTRTGDPKREAGVIPVHRNEFVANHESVANPHVRQFLDVFDVAQRRGTIRLLNTTQILERVRVGGGKYAGGYVDDTARAATATPAAASGQPLTTEERTQLVRLMQENNDLLRDIKRKELVVDPRKVRDGIRNVEKLESNVSR
ncbi:MAG: phage tail tape measure protein [Mediterranea sp.]|jgi:TP901 family phage tail tape measure protein|nr:phage tail tape measure protein [Mediterranea sp.]